MRAYQSGALKQANILESERKCVTAKGMLMRDKAMKVNLYERKQWFAFGTPIGVSFIHIHHKDMILYEKNIKNRDMMIENN